MRGLQRLRHQKIGPAYMRQGPYGLQTYMSVGLVSGKKGRKCLHVSLNFAPHSHSFSLCCLPLQKYKHTKKTKYKKERYRNTKLQSTEGNAVCMSCRTLHLAVFTSASCQCSAMSAVQCRNRDVISACNTTHHLKMKAQVVYNRHPCFPSCSKENLNVGERKCRTVLNYRNVNPSNVKWRTVVECVCDDRNINLPKRRIRTAQGQGGAETELHQAWTSSLFERRSHNASTCPPALKCDMCSASGLLQVVKVLVG